MLSIVLVFLGDYIGMDLIFPDIFRCILLLDVINYFYFSGFLPLYSLYCVSIISKSFNYLLVKGVN